MLTISQGTNILARTSAWLDLHDITDLYERALVTNVITSFPQMRSSSAVSGFTSLKELSPQPDETKQMVVFVHGWNDDDWQCANYAQTIFKRLYWQGYHGRLAALRWPTLVGVFTYNRSEFIALRSAQGASDYFTWLHSRLPDYSINVLAHSMGNVIMMETLRLQLAAGSHAIDNYVLTQGSEAAHCYDPNLPDYPDFNPLFTGYTPDTYRGYPGAISNAVNGSLVNFFNTNDFALATGLVAGLASWEDNEIHYKPNSQFDYYYYANTNTAIYQPSGSPAIVVTDPRELMAFVARPRSKAVGAQGGALGQVRGNIKAEVDLRGSFGFNDSIAEHSAQFNWSIQQVNGYYEELLTQMKISAH